MRKSIPSIQQKAEALKKKQSAGQKGQLDLAEYIENIYDYSYNERQQIFFIQEGFNEWCRTFNKES